MWDFKERTAIVTGAGSGIGYATADLLAAAGANVILVGRRREPLEKARAQISAHGGTVRIVAADASTREGAAEPVQVANSEFGRLDLAVNAAGVAGVASLVESDEALFDSLMDANVRSVWLAMKNQIPAIAAAGGGAIVNLSSRAGLVGTRFGSVYSAAKHAVIGLTKSAAIEAGPLGIRVNAVCPGQTQTPQFDSIVAQAMPDMSVTEAAEMFGAKLPLGRIAAPAEIANTIAWLLSPAASFVTGTAIPVDGGGSAG